MSEQELKNLFDQSIEEAQGYYFGQSDKVSTISRTIVFGMIATIWVVWYRDGEINNLHWVMVLALLLCFVYLLFELICYFANACFYHKQLDNLDKYFGKKNYLDKKYNDDLQAFSKKAYIWLIVKFSFFLLCAVCFLSGMIFHFFL